MKLSEALRTGGGEIRAHKMRSFLSFLSISIGTGAFMYTFTMLSGMNRQMATAMELMGPGRMNIEEKRNYEQKSAQSQRKLSYADALAIRREMPDLYMVSPTASEHVRFRHGVKTGRLTTMGIAPDWARREWVYKLRGRFINETDLSGFARVCVVVEKGDWNLGKKPSWVKFWGRKDESADAYIKHKDLLGEYIVLQDHLYKIVGVIKNPPRDADPRWFSDGNDADVLIPLTTYSRFIASADSGDSVEQISVDAGTERKLPAVKRQLEILLKARHDGAVNFRIRPMQEIMANYISEERKRMLTMLALGIIAMLSGGVGIMNVTLATIYARIKEIGVRRAIGATRFDIITQFVVEATLLGLLGGVFGIGLGYLMTRYMNPGNNEYLEVFIWWVPAASASIAVLAGFIFSLYPAWSASKLDPVEALRYE